MVAVESFRSADYTLPSFGIIGTIVVSLVCCCIFENGVLLMYTLEGVSSVADFITPYEESQ